MRAQFARIVLSNPGLDGVTLRSDRSEYLRFTVLTFEKHLGRTVTMEEAREIAENTLAWLEWIEETSVTSGESSAIVGG